MPITATTDVISHPLPENSSDFSTEYTLGAVIPSNDEVNAGKRFAGQPPSETTDQVQHSLIPKQRITGPLSGAPLTEGLKVPTMTKRKAPKRRTAWTTSASTSPAHSTTVASRPEAVATIDSGFHLVGEFQIDYYDAKPRISRTCVLAFVETGRKPHRSCDHCSGTDLGDVVWEGTLWDSNSVFGMEESGPFASASLCVNRKGDRDGIALELKGLANKIGYEYCDVRVYTFGSSIDYTPLFSGPLAAMCSVS